MSESYRASLRVTELDEYGLPVEPEPLPPEPPPGFGRMSRRGLITLAGGLALGGSAVLPGMFAAQPVNRLADGQQVAGQPAIYDCESWGARKPSSPVKELDDKPSKIIVHHTATTNSNDVTVPDLGILARSIQTFHMKTNGWIDTGQHFTINRGGLIAEGRHRSLETLLEGDKFIEGAHCVNQNESSIGIENQGTYTQINPPVGQFTTLRNLCVFICKQYGLTASDLYGHRDFWDTACPGDKFYALLPTLRSQVGQLLGEKPGSGKDRGGDQLASTAYHQPSWPLLRIADKGSTVLAAQHLLRGAGVTSVPADGEFGRATADGVMAFQRQHGMAANGMIGGGSWPLLAVPVRIGQGGERDAAVHALTSGGKRTWPGARLPSTITATEWKQLLSSAATPT
ncbi:peptidoglycan recognition protein family protein [Pseudonocardia spinosispora]|uniref:peptidoglycan recognition protein family protein n=1 Tax=Pseudonocardia spinosispora TaxID=103441 RepID=UPI00040C2688|nr:N-acetylmuramoyl-L-alanine amidase [Pseudonocardia spinosispora]